MKRMGWASGSLAVIALLLTACSDSGGSTLSEDDFVDELNSVCDDAGRDIRRLDVADRNFFDDVLDIMQTGADDLKELKPPSDLEDDFNDFVENLDDQIQQTENLRDAVDDDDEDAATDASGELTDLAADANDLAESIGADDCVDIGVDTSTTDTTDPDVSTPNTPLPIDTTIPSTPPPTDPPPTDPPVTDPPATTAPVTTPATMPEMTIPAGNGEGEGLALDASLSWAPPAGFDWGVLEDLASASTPYGNTVVAPTLVGYWAGIIQNPSTNQAALVYFSESSADWTGEQLEALFDFELSGGADATTPAGAPARIALGVGSEGQFDAGLIYTSRNTVTVYALAGTLDVLATLDAIVTANTMGG